MCHSCSFLAGACISAEWSIYKPDPSLLFFGHLNIRNAYEAIGADWKREGNVAEIGTPGIWATSRELRVHSVPT